MTFEEFQQSKVYWDDINSHPLVDNGNYDNKVEGYVYTNGPYIEIVNHEDGKFYLMLGNMQWLSDDLESLELALFVWAIDEGYYDA